MCLSKVTVNAEVGSVHVGPRPQTISLKHILFMTITSGPQLP